MKKILYLFIFLISLLFFSCRKGCTDPLAYNYNANRTVDNGKCKYYDLVYLDSIKISRINSQNELGNNWDSGDSLDYDNDESNPDVSLKVITPSGYHAFSVNMFTNVNPFYPDIVFDFNNDFASDMWSSNGFSILIYEFEMDFSTQLIDSVYIKPFDANESRKSDRFKKRVVLDYFADSIGLTAFFSWD